MINTSELQVNAVIAADHAAEGTKRLEKAFAGSLR